MVIPDLGVDIDETPAARRAVARWLSVNAQGPDALPLIISPQLALFCSYWLQRSITDA